MNGETTECDHRQLAVMLHSDDAEPSHRALLEHVEDCQDCQKRLRQLAADEDDWSRARSVLATSDDQHGDGSSSQPLFARWSNRPIIWEESMVRELLDQPTHPELLGRLGRYEVERLIGSGGMGIVFKAHDTELNRPSAIKLLAPYLAGNGSARKRFAREARAAAGVVDDHVVPIYNVESENEPPFLVMQYVAGGSLQEKLDRDGPLDVAETLRIGMQTAKGLAAAHAQGLIHRDVKPSNILLDEGVERALLTDFGLARAEDDACLTRSGFHPGTPHYMSPEQVRGEAIDGRSDLFSLGCVLYALCTGHPPFRAETSYAVLRRITDDIARPIRELNPDIPEWLERIVMKLLSKSCEDRFGSAEQVAELLKECLAHVQHPTTTPLPSLPEPTALAAGRATNSTGPEASAYGSQVRRWLVAAAFGFSLIFAGVLIVLEMNKGTLTIESDADDVPIRITQGDDIVKELTVTKGTESIRIAAGNYLVEIDGKFDGVVVDEKSVSLKRGEEENVKLRLENALAAADNSEASYDAESRLLTFPSPEAGDFSMLRGFSFRSNGREDAAKQDVVPSGDAPAAFQIEATIIDGDQESLGDMSEGECFRIVTEDIERDISELVLKGNAQIKSRPKFKVRLGETSGISIGQSLDMPELIPSGNDDARQQVGIALNITPRPAQNALLNLDIQITSTQVLGNPTTTKSQPSDVPAIRERTFCFRAPISEFGGSVNEFGGSGVLLGPFALEGNRCRALYLVVTPVDPATTDSADQANSKTKENTSDVSGYVPDGVNASITIPVTIKGVEPEKVSDALVPDNDHRPPSKNAIDCEPQYMALREYEFEPTEHAVRCDFEGISFKIPSKMAAQARIVRSSPSSIWLVFEDGGRFMQIPLGSEGLASMISDPPPELANTTIPDRLAKMATAASDDSASERTLSERRIYDWAIANRESVGLGNSLDRFAVRSSGTLHTILFSADPGASFSEKQIRSWFVWQETESGQYGMIMFGDSSKDIATWVNAFATSFDSLPDVETNNLSASEYATMADDKILNRLDVEKVFDTVVPSRSSGISEGDVGSEANLPGIPAVVPANPLPPASATEEAETESNAVDTPIRTNLPPSDPVAINVDSDNGIVVLRGNKESVELTAEFLKAMMNQPNSAEKETVANEVIMDKRKTEPSTPWADFSTAEPSFGLSPAAKALSNLHAEFREIEATYTKARDEAVDEVEYKRVRKGLDPRAIMPSKYLAFEEEHRGTDSGLRALTAVAKMALGNADPASNGYKRLVEARRRVTAHYLDHHGLESIAELFDTWPFFAESDGFLQTLIDKSPHRETRAKALIAQIVQGKDLLARESELPAELDKMVIDEEDSPEFNARLRNLRKQLEDMDFKQFRADLNEKLKELAETYSDIDVAVYGTGGEAAKSLGHAINQVIVGAEAPEMTAIDIKGQEFRLSKLRGKIVVLLFAEQEEDYKEMYGPLRQLVAKYERAPVEFVGIMSNTDPANLLAASKRGDLTWTVIPQPLHYAPLQLDWGIEEDCPVFIVDKQGILQPQLHMPYYGDGGYDAGEVGDKIAELLKKPLVSPYGYPATAYDGMPGQPARTIPSRINPVEKK